MSLMLNTGAMQYKADGSSGWQPLTLVANVDLASLADAFSESSTYEVGEYVRRDSRVYRCITAIQTAGAWDSTKWTEVTLADEIRSVYGELKTEITHLRPNQLKRRWIFIGDSYGHASGTNNGWIDKLVTLLGLSSSDYYESGIGGAGFTTSSAGPFLSMITTLAASITDKGSITDIVVCGGANDIATDASTISTAIQTFNTYCKTTFPNAQIWIGAAIASNNSNNIVPQYLRTKEGYSNCGIATYLHNLEYVFQNRDLIGSDGVHPTANGYEILAEKIYGALNGGCDVKYRGWHYAFVSPTGYSAEESASAYYSVVVDNGITNIWTAGRVGKLASNSSYYFSVSNGSAITLAYMATPLFVAPKSSLDSAYWNCIKCPARAEVRSTINNTWYAVDGYCMITNADEIPSGNTRNTLQFVPIDAVVLGTTSAFNSCDRIRVTGVGFTIASELC